MVHSNDKGKNLNYGSFGLCNTLVTFKNCCERPCGKDNYKDLQLAYVDGVIFSNKIPDKYLEHLRTVLLKPVLNFF